MDNELTILLAEKLGLACDYVEANGAEIFNRYIQSETSIAIMKAVIFSLMAIVGLCMLINFIKASHNNDTRFFDITELHYFDDIKNLNSRGIVLVSIMSFMLIVGLVGAPFAISSMLRWITCPEIQAIKSLGL